MKDTELEMLIVIVSYRIVSFITNVERALNEQVRPPAHATDTCAAKARAQEQDTRVRCVHGWVGG